VCLSFLFSPFDGGIVKLALGIPWDVPRAQKYSSQHKSVLHRAKVFFTKVFFTGHKSIFHSTERGPVRLGS